MEVWIHISEEDWLFIAAQCNAHAHYSDNEGKCLRNLILAIAERLEIGMKEVDFEKTS